MFYETNEQNDEDVDKNNPNQSVKNTGAETYSYYRDSKNFAILEDANPSP